MIVYFLSGLGADERVFKRLTLPAGFEMKHLPWQSAAEEESLEDYAKKMALSIDDSEPFILAGLSFGGIVAREIAEFKKPELLILFSTIEGRRELPRLYRIAARLRLYNYLPGWLLRYTLPFLLWFFGPLDSEARLLIKSFLQQTNPDFLRWALKQIACWNPKMPFKPVIHIHGRLDRTFPASLCHAQHLVDNAGHLCVFTHAGAINDILAACLRK
jgi:pimeloyl-ACP methyl ester carboxylesterase